MIFDDRPESSADTRETSQLWLRVIWGLCAAVCVLAILVWIAQRHMANQTEGPTTVIKASAGTEDSGTGHFELAEDRLKNMDGIEIDAAADRIVFHLQKWANAQKAAPDWIADPLFNSLPKRLGYSGKQNLLSRLTFDNGDVYALREAFWLRDVSKRIAQQGSVDADIEAWLQSAENELGLDSVRQLRVVCRLFDWVNRNIQLEPDSLANVTKSLEQPFPNGAGRMSWEGMLMGRGHAWVRAQILILLARQQHLDVVMLGLRNESAEPTPWVTAALLGGKLYLFDTRLGLPIPSTADGRGVATLGEVIANSELLGQLDAPGHEYAVKKVEPDSIIALIHATPSYLSQRMKLIEPQLTGEFKTVLTTEPSKLRQSLLKLSNIRRVTIWALPYDAIRYASAISRTPETRMQRASRLFVFEGDRPLAMARRRYFQGVFSDRPPKVGAKSYLLECRISDSRMPEAAAEGVMNFLKQTNQTPDDYSQEQLQAMQQEIYNRLMQSKRAATYWLALLNFEEGKYQVTLDYLEKRVIPIDKGSFLQGARYNLGRTYERLAATGSDDAWRRAVEQYLADESSPQFAGNWIRAERIKRRVKESED